MNLKLRYLIPGTVILLLALSFLAVQWGYLRFNYPSWETYPIRGIDVSHHQGNIRWEETKKNQISFVYVKASEGTQFRDPKFLQNWKGARQAGLPVGAYHFFSFCRPADEQAANFIRVVPNEVDSLTLPPTIDVEYGGNCAHPPTKEIIRAEVKEMSDRLERHYSRMPLLYLTRNAYEELYEESPPTNPIWIRNIFFAPHFPPPQQWTLWQFANRGQLSGIPRPVDLNVFNGSLPEWMKFLASPSIDPE